MPGLQLTEARLFEILGRLYATKEVLAQEAQEQTAKVAALEAAATAATAEAAPPVKQKGDGR